MTPEPRPGATPRPDRASRSAPVLRRLTPEDARPAAALYNHAVRHTDATLDEDERTLEEALSWVEEHSGDRYPAFGAIVGGELAGYGTLSPFARRGGYRASAEISVYVAPEHQGAGIGSALCAALTRHAERAGMATVLALITSTNTASQRLFRAAGYTYTGTMRHIGCKLGHLVDLDLLQRMFPRNVPLYDLTAQDVSMHDASGHDATGHDVSAPGPAPEAAHGVSQYSAAPDGAPLPPRRPS